jgi:hypothetical protein
MNPSPEHDINADEDFVANQIRAALDMVFANVDLQGAEPEYEVTWHPKGRAIKAVNMIASVGMELERVREALAMAIQQIDTLL